MNSYDPKSIELKWQKIWEETGIYTTPSHTTKEKKMYILPQLPYPSGSGLHVGHAEVYAACDIYARYQRMKGKDVLQVLGWDAFGLPAENYAIKTNVHPRKSTNDAIDNFRQQIKSLGISVDWEREVGSHNPDYYQWTQWFFLLMYKRGLAYRKKQAVNWCDSCKTVLANEQVTNAGTCERCDTLVLQKDMEQWYVKITDYAEQLLEGLDRIDWPEETKKRQRDWIGKSEGAEITFELTISDEQVTVFTTRPDTIFGATYLVLAPEHALIQKIKDSISNWNEVEAYIAKTAEKTELDRQVDQEKTGVELQGIKAINPVNGEEISIWIADYVLASYGTGAIMAVPAHDERDFAFAKQFGLAIKQVVAPYVELTGVCAPQADKETTRKYVVSAIVRDAQKDEYLLLQWPGGIGGFVGGGIEEGETAEQAILREVQEETGYHDVIIKKEIIIPQFFGHGYKPRKGINCYDFEHVYVVDVSHHETKELHEEDKSAHDIIWKKRDEVLAYISLDHHKQIWKWYAQGQQAITEEGIAIESDLLNGLSTKQAKEKIIQYLEEKGIGKRKIQYKLRDWSVSRQRFWGAPIPMLYDEQGNLHPVPEQDLPVILPDDVDFKPTGESPLRYSELFNAGVEERYGKGWKREPDTLDTFMCSSWYYYRYLDPKNDAAFASPDALKNWMPVDFYLGGAEHVNGHLLYARFFTKVLHDAGYIDFDEPFTVHRHQGLILGEDNRKMSKRWGNVINPTDIVNEYGADTCRMYEMFMGPLEEAKPWSTGGVVGVRRFLEKTWQLYMEFLPHVELYKDRTNKELETTYHQTIKHVTHHIETLGFNTAISELMKLVNSVLAAKKKGEMYLNSEMALGLIKMLSPFAPHMASELFSLLQQADTTINNDVMLDTQPWPVANETKMLQDTMTLAVQVNGKLRGTIVVSATALEGEITTLACAETNVMKWIEGKEIKKLIYIPKKLVSIVV